MHVCIYKSTPRGKLRADGREENKRRPWWNTVLLIISTSADEGIRKSTDERVHVYISYLCMYVRVYMIYIYIRLTRASVAVAAVSEALR